MSRSLTTFVSAAKRKLVAHTHELDRHDAFPPRAIASLVLLLFVLLPTRRIGLFLHPNFYAEDGLVWYKQAYSSGWLHSLTVPESGYLQTLQRVLTGVALAVPFHLAPLVNAVTGLLVQLLPVPILLSTRCRNWGPLSLRCLFASMYVLFPNGGEIHVVITNAQWYLALAMLLLAFAEPPASSLGKAADALFFLFAGFCGPFGLLLIPLMFALRLFAQHRTWIAMQVVCVAVGSVAQIYELLHGPARPHAYLGASVSRFLHILGVEVFLYAITGGHSFLIHIPGIVTALALLLGTSFLVYCLLRSPLALRSFIVYAALLLAVSLRSPLIASPKPLWQMLIEDPICRYWFLPELAFLWSLAWCARSAPLLLMRKAAQVAVVLALVGGCISWRYAPFPNFDFGAHAGVFERAAPGTLVRIPIYPNADYSMTLQKR